MKPIIRLFKPLDLNEVHSIECESFRFPWPKPSFLFTYYNNPKGFLVAVKNGRVIGYVIANIWENIETHEKYGHLLNLAVSKKFRHQGIGRALVKRILSYLRSEGAKYILLEVRASNLAARNLYLSLGFKEAETVKGYYQDGENAIIMVRKL